MSGHRTFLGTGVRNTDNGRVVDIGALRGILHPLHTLHRRADPRRYSMENPEFVSFVERIVKEGPPPAPILFRKKGILLKKEPEYLYLKATYPEDVRDEEPVLETVFGNRRFYGLIEAHKIWSKDPALLEQMVPGGKVRLLAMYKALSDEAAEAEFVDENANRVSVSIYEQHLTVRARLNAGQTWDEIADRLRVPEKELRRTHVPLNDAHLAVVMAFSEGSITRNQLLQIIKLDLGKQPAAIDDPKLISKPATPREKRLSPREIPRAEIRSLAELCINGDLRGNAKQVLKWLEGIDG